MNLHWQIVPNVQELLTTLRLMEGLHNYAASYSTGQVRIQHIRLAESYRKAINYIERLDREGMILPF